MKVIYGTECETQEIANSLLLWQKDYEAGVRASIACENLQLRPGTPEWIEKWLSERLGTPVILRYAILRGIEYIYGYDHRTSL